MKMRISKKRIAYLERMEEKAVSQIMYMRKGKIEAAMACMHEIDLLFTNAGVVACDCDWTPANDIAPGAEICVHCHTVRVSI